MADSEPHLLVERRDGVLVLTMNRPAKRNALSPEMLVRMAAAFREFRDAHDLRVAILTGAGDEDFCSGGDLELTLPLMTGARKPDGAWDHRLLADPSQFGDAILRGFELYKPVIAAVNGRALGGGTEMTNACDLRVAAEHATFGLLEVSRGIIPGAGGTQRLPRMIPVAKAMEIILMAQRIDAQEALRLGLVNRVVPAAEVMPTALKMAEQIQQNGPLAVRAAKEAIVRGMSLPLDEGLRLESVLQSYLLRTEDAVEGPKAFAEKRKANFKAK